MKLSELKVGQVVVFYPAKVNKDDNRHPRATVVEVGQRRMTIEVEGDVTEQGGARRRSVSPRSLANQPDMLV